MNLENCASREHTVLNRYCFEHALFQQYVYTQLSAGERRIFHSNVADTLEELYKDNPNTIAVQLARHFRLAQRTEKAISYLTVAGHQASRLSAQDEAFGHYSTALKLLLQQDESPERNKLELMLQASIGACEFERSGFASRGANRAFTRALELCDENAPQQFLIAVQYGLFSSHGAFAELDCSNDYAIQMKALTDQSPHKYHKLAACFALGFTNFHAGNLKLSRRYLDDVYQNYTVDAHDPAVGLFGHDPANMGLSLRGINLWFLGLADSAKQAVDYGNAKANEVDYPFTRATNLIWGSTVYQMSGDYEKALELLDEGLQVAKHHQFPFWTGYGEALRSFLLYKLRGYDATQDLLEKGIEAYARTRVRTLSPHIYGLFIEAYLEQGNLDRATELLNEANKSYDSPAESFFSPELLRFEAEIILKRGGDSSGAWELLDKAVELAQNQGSKALELRVRTTQVEYSERDAKLHFQDELRLCTNSFVEGASTRDLKKATSLLEMELEFA